MIDEKFYGAVTSHQPANPLDGNNTWALSKTYRLLQPFVLRHYLLLLGHLVHRLQINFKSIYRLLKMCTVI